MNIQKHRDGEPHDPPANDIETAVAAIFERILNYAPVGRLDDFFLLGGDSLSAMELNACLVTRFGCSVPDLIEDGTVAGLAEVIGRNAADPARSRRLMPVLLPRRREGTPPVLFLVHGGRGQAHVGSRFMELIGNDQPLYLFQARGVDGIQQPHVTIHDMAQEYVSAMRAVQERGPYFIGGMCTGGFVALKMAHILRQAGEQVGPLLLIDPPVPPFTAEQTLQNLQSLVPGLRALEGSGHIDFDFNDANRRKGAVQVVIHFDRAMLRDKPEPYDGPVHLLATASRLSANGWGDASKRATYFAGELHCYSVGARHAQILDTNNEEFARHLGHCVRSARAAIAALAGRPKT